MNPDDSNALQFDVVRVRLHWISMAGGSGLVASIFGATSVDSPLPFSVPTIFAPFTVDVLKAEMEGSVIWAHGQRKMTLKIYLNCPDSSSTRLPVPIGVLLNHQPVRLVLVLFVQESLILWKWLCDAAYHLTLIYCPRLRTSHPSCNPFWSTYFPLPFVSPIAYSVQCLSLCRHCIQLLLETLVHLSVISNRRSQCILDPVVCPTFECGINVRPHCFRGLRHSLSTLGSMAVLSPMAVEWALVQLTRQMVSMLWMWLCPRTSWLELQLHRLFRQLTVDFVSAMNANQSRSGRPFSVVRHAPFQDPPCILHTEWMNHRKCTISNQTVDAKWECYLCFESFNFLVLRHHHHFQRFQFLRQFCICRFELNCFGICPIEQFCIDQIHFCALDSSEFYFSSVWIRYLDLNALYARIKCDASLFRSNIVAIIGNCAIRRLRFVRFSIQYSGLVDCLSDTVSDSGQKVEWKHGERINTSDRPDVSRFFGFGLKDTCPTLMSVIAGWSSIDFPAQFSLSSVSFNTLDSSNARLLSTTTNDSSPADDMFEFFVLMAEKWSCSIDGKIDNERPTPSWRTIGSTHECEAEMSKIVLKCCCRYNPATVSRRWSELWRRNIENSWLSFRYVYPNVWFEGISWTCVVRASPQSIYFHIISSLVHTPMYVMEKKIVRSPLAHGFLGTHVTAWPHSWHGDWCLEK